MAKPLLTALGLISLVLGAVGIVLPLLPTTPFLLLSAYCFARSSGRLQSYLLGHRIFGEYISNYYNREMTRPHKIRTLGVMWAGIIICCIAIGSVIPWILLPGIATLVSIHIIRLRPRPEHPDAAAAKRVPAADSVS